MRLIPNLGKLIPKVLTIVKKPQPSLHRPTSTGRTFESCWAGNRLSGVLARHRLHIIPATWVKP